VRQVKHHGALPYQNVPKFMKRLQEVPGVSSSALAFLILTAARTSEALNATLSEFALESDPTWVVPADRMKAKREHRVPLSVQAVALVKSMAPLNGADESRYVFPSPIREAKPLSDMSLLVLVKRLAARQHIGGEICLRNAER
jgi:integrase